VDSKTLSTIREDTIGIRSFCNGADHLHAMQRLVQEIDEQYRCGWHTAAQLVVRYRGCVILDYVSGKNDRQARLPLTHESQLLVCSIGKSLLALCIHHWAEAERIDLDRPIADFWPEFSCCGKQAITLRHTLLHQAGLPKHALYRQLLFGQKMSTTTRRLANARPRHSPGSVSAYHPLNYGYILGEVLQRVSGIPLQKYLEKYFLIPMKLRTTTWEPSRDQMIDIPRIYAAHVSQQPAAWLFNRIRRYGIHNPGFNLYSNARELAVIFQMLANGGTYRGCRVLSEKTVRSAVELRYKGVDATIGRETLWAEGFHLGGRKTEHDWRPGPAMGVRSSVSTFGHCGHMSSIVWADAESNLVLAFTCNGLLNGKGAARRWQRLADLAWGAVSQTD